MVKVLDITHLENTFGEIRKQKKKIVLVGGCFDILHLGHMRLFQHAKEKGDVLAVMLESDKKIEQTKGINRPIHSQKERAEMLSGIRYIDYIIPLPFIADNEIYDTIVQQIHPDIIVTTEGDVAIIHKKRQAQKIGAQIALVNKPLQHISTTNILSLLQKEL